MTRYLVDLTGLRLSAGKPATGVVRVERELAQRAHQHLPDGSLFVFYDPQTLRFHSLGPVAAAMDLESPVPRGPIVNIKDTDELISFGLECNNKDYRALIFGARDIGYRIHSVLYDITGPLNPQLTIKGYGEFLRGFFADMCWGVSRFYAISDHTRRQMIQLEQEEFLPAVPTVVFRLGSDNAASLGTASELREAKKIRPDWLVETAVGTRRYVLYVSTIEARKNHYVAYRSWARSVESGAIDPATTCLVFAGKVGWGVADLIEQMSIDEAARSSIIIMSDLEDEAIEDLYRHCAFTIFTSLDEGYGLPVAESLARGKVCICSSAGALPEVGGDLVTYVDPIDIPGWRSEVERHLGDLHLLADTEKRIKDSYSAISWDESAAEFYSAVQGAF